MASKLLTKFFLSALLAGLFVGATAAARQDQQSAAKQDIVGKWHFVFETEGGPREFNAEFQLDGTKVSGKWDNSADVKGTYSEGKLSLEFPVNSEEAGPGTLKLDGELADNALTGTWSFGQYDGTFKAARPKA